MRNIGWETSEIIYNERELHARRVITRHTNVQLDGKSYVADNPSHHSRVAGRGRSANLALRFGLGLLSFRRLGPCPRDRLDPRPRRPAIDDAGRARRTTAPVFFVPRTRKNSRDARRASGKLALTPKGIVCARWQHVRHRSPQHASVSASFTIAKRSPFGELDDQFGRSAVRSADEENTHRGCRMPRNRRK